MMSAPLFGGQSEHHTRASGVVSATVKAALVMPGVVASSRNVGARGFGDWSCSRWVA